MDPNNSQFNPNMLSPSQLQDFIKWCKENPQPNISDVQTSNQIPSISNNPNLFSTEPTSQHFPISQHFQNTEEDVAYTNIGEPTQTNSDEVVKQNKPKRGRQTKGTPSIGDQSHTKRTTGGAWSVEEDLALLGAYIESGGDQRKATDQTSEDFWENIIQLFEMARENNPDFPKRTTDAIQSRWKRINKDVTAFVSKYSEAKICCGSGSNATNVLNKARAIWSLSDNGRKFPFEHLWEEMGNYPRWQEPTYEIRTESDGSSKRAEPEPSPGGTMARPKLA
ncbi:glutathione S-transferase T2-like [Spinacia oleracea]|uniref:Glutathione S-transferase T2-like n=1 Tax=Spinacia oleracea TaxID=3562 RepID=A0A9R0HW18_SPIOL|nr:glutathione S-transferase T2-like [Spinacia oleracea]